MKTIKQWFLGLLLLFVSFGIYAQTALPTNFRQDAQKEFDDLKANEKEGTFVEFYNIKVSDFQRINAQAPAPGPILVPQNTTMCKNGDFESPLSALDWRGAYGSLFTSGPSNDLPDFANFTNGFSSGAINSASARQTIVAAGPDPNVPINTTRTGTGNSMRIGNQVSGHGSEMISKRFNVTATNSVIAFWYATVLVDPSNFHAVEAHPSFWVRVIDHTAGGVVLTGLTDLGNGTEKIYSDVNDPLFQVSGNLAYKDWSCAKIDLSGVVGHNIEINFISEDCGLGGHFGYTYIDDFCGNCDKACLIKAPDSLKCDITRAGQNLTWSPVFNAVSYEIEIYKNDPNCCRSGNPGSITLPIPVNGTSYLIPNLTDCFSWRVRAVCADGTKSDWSKPSCSCGPVSVCFITAPINLNCAPSSLGQTLSWTPVINAVSYEIQIYKNDPKCCGSGNPGSISLPISVNGTSYVVPNIGDCFSWKVRAVCADGTKSAWSATSCSCGLSTGCVIKTPEQLTCNLAFGGQNLAWSAITNAVSYQIEFHYNDPKCCTAGLPSISLPISVTTNAFTVSDLSRCFSWRVRAVCADGTLSAWSKSSCSCGLQTGVITPSSKTTGSTTTSKGSSLGNINELEIHHSAVPNPSNSQVTIKFHDHNNAVDVNNAVIVINDIANREVYKSTISINEAKKIDVSEFKAGIFVYRIIYQDKVLVTDKLIVE